MKSNIVLVLCLLISFVATDVDARRGGGSSFSRSSSRSYSRPSSSPRRSSSPKKVSPKPSRNTQKKSTIKKASTTKKPKAISKSKLDKNRQKQLATQNKSAVKKYGNKATAEKAYRQKIASSNKYTSKTPPATRPSHIPQTASVGGRSVNVTYSALPGGGYGYGYYDPITNAFVGLAAHQMMVDAAMMRSAGYGHWGADGRPVVVHRGPSTGLIIFFIILGVGVVIAIIVVASKLSEL